jgi:hypothetical protein
MTTHNADGKELFICGACKCRHTADEFDLDRHGIRRKCCIPCQVKREAGKCENTALVCAAQRTCQECGSNHRNRKDNICNNCRLPKCVLCQIRWHRRYGHHDRCDKCYSNPPRTKPVCDRLLVMVAPPTPTAQPPWQDQWHDPPRACERLSLQTQVWARQELYSTGSARCIKCTEILRPCEAEMCASCCSRSRCYPPAKAL